MRSLIITYVATALAFLGCDAVWLSVMASRLYRPHLGDLLQADFAPAPALAFYAIYIAGIMVFAIDPARAAGSWGTAAWRGAFLGLVAYATYDLTNQATLRNWPLTITLADLCWGTVLTALAATVGFIVARWMA
ncbi:DUF2177 family protein [Novosphingobium terrae]|uniref:DUF2177 family protein n=1 Tax=Novosphingobium terrae TaxID=2726189 RepID=UPI0019801F6D|nr:DUF2177 family protein [Novosphingobium terrae]